MFGQVPVGVELRVLQLLKEQTQLCGKEMLEKDRALKKGSIYTVLARMQERGYLSSWVEAREGTRGLGVRMYRLTGEGEQALAAGTGLEMRLAGKLAW